MERRFFPILLLTLLVTAGLAVGCGDDEDDEQSPDRTSAEALRAQGAGQSEDAETTTATVPTESPPAERPVAEEPTELEIEEIAEGSGPPVRAGDTVDVRYTGRLFEDGTEFDSNAQAGPPLPVEVGSGAVIPGFDQGLVGMREGGKRIVTIPSDLGYGAQGSPPAIPPDAALVFEIEIESIGN